MINAFLLPSVGGSWLTTGRNLCPSMPRGRAGAGRCSCLGIPPIPCLQAPGYRLPRPGPQDSPNTAGHRGDRAAVRSCLALGCGTQGLVGQAGPQIEGARQGGAVPTPGDSRVTPPSPEARLQLRLWAPAPQEHSPALVKGPAPRLVGRWSPTSHRPGCPAPGVQFQEEVRLKDEQGLELPPSSAFKQSLHAVITKARLLADAWPTARSRGRRWSPACGLQWAHLSCGFPSPCSPGGGGGGGQRAEEAWGTDRCCFAGTTKPPRRASSQTHQGRTSLPGSRGGVSNWGPV